MTVGASILAESLVLGEDLLPLGELVLVVPEVDLRHDDHYSPAFSLGRCAFMLPSKADVCRHMEMDREAVSDHFLNRQLVAFDVDVELKIPTRYELPKENRRPRWK